MRDISALPIQRTIRLKPYPELSVGSRAQASLPLVSHQESQTDPPNDPSHKLTNSSLISDN